MNIVKQIKKASTCFKAGFPSLHSAFYWVPSHCSIAPGRQSKRAYERRGQQNERRMKASWTREGEALTHLCFLSSQGREQQAPKARQQKKQQQKPSWAQIATTGGVLPHQKPRQATGGSNFQRSIPNREDYKIQTSFQLAPMDEAWGPKARSDIIRS